MLPVERVLGLVVAITLITASCAPSTDVAEPRPTATALRATALPATALPAPTIERPTPAAPQQWQVGVDAYRGLGAWVDVWDWAPSYTSADSPPVGPSEIERMAEHGVTTLYIQASRLDDRGSGPIESAELLAEWIAMAHDHDIAVVGWYLPRWEDAAEDLARLVAIAEFDIDGNRFDGVAVDIEGVPRPDQRADWNKRLVDLSTQLRTAVGPMALGAIVLPPTLLEVVNVDYWPEFPWAALAPLYDVWLPMSYWSFRADDSPFANGYDYNADATRRLRSNLGDSQATVHAIGGIGAVIGDANTDASEPAALVSELDGFVRSLVDTDAIGGSIYDWASMDEVGRQTMTNAMRTAGLTAE